MTSPVDKHQGNRQPLRLHLSAEICAHFANVMLPSVRVWNPEGNFIFQQDTHPVHCSMGVQRWFARRPEIELIRWPPKSPDLNVVERMWSKLKEGRILRYGNNPPRNPQQLYGIRLWKSGMISLRTTTITLSWSNICPEGARRSYMPVACGQGIRYTCYYFFVCFNLLVFLCFVGKKIYLPIGYI